MASSEQSTSFDSVELKENDESNEANEEFEEFMLKIRCMDESERNTALANVLKVIKILDPIRERVRIQLIFRIIESEFLANYDLTFRCTFLEQIPFLIVEADRIDYDIFNEVCDIFMNLLFISLDSMDKNNYADNVSKTAFNVIGKLVEQRIIPAEYLQDLICRKLLFEYLSSSDIGDDKITDKEELKEIEKKLIVDDILRLNSILLISKIIEYQGDELSKRWISESFLPPYVQLLHNKTIRIKKELILLLPKISALLGQKFTEEFSVPYLLTLAIDDRCWSNRGSCCEIIPEISRLCTAETRELRLAPLFITLLYDDARWVVRAAFENLGPFIATFADTGQICSTRSPAFDAENNHVEGSDILKEDFIDNIDFTHLLVGFIPLYLPRRGRKTESYASTEIIVNELTSLLNKWNANQWRKNSEKAVALLETKMFHESAAAVCTTHTDLSKLFVEEDVDGFQFMFEEEVNDEEKTTASNELKEGDEMSGYSEYSYWKTDFVDIDVNYYGRKNSGTNSFSSVFRFLDSFYPNLKNNGIKIEFGEMDYPHSRGKTDFEEGSALFLENRSVLKCGETFFDSELNIPKELIESYVKIASSCSSIDISYLCAHNFPAIAYTIGRENWPHIKEAYIHLSTDVQCRVRLSLASSIHEVAAIIGEENSAKYLVPAFEMFMKDIEDVRLVLLNHLYDFFKLLPSGTRSNLLTTLATFLHSTTGNDINWRFRHEYASQCILLCDLYDVYDLNKYLSGIALTLANDKVADVRKMGTILLASILGKFVQEEWCLDSSSVSTDESPIPITESFVNDIIKAFARSMSWQRRQTFALFCQKCLDDGRLNYDQFSSLLLDDLVQLMHDPVVNVRIAFARALAGTRGGRAFHGSRDSTLVRKCLETLTSDIDADCRYVARISLGIGDGETIIDVKNRGERIRQRENSIFGIEKVDKEVSTI